MKRKIGHKPSNNRKLIQRLTITGDHMRVFLTGKEASENANLSGPGDLETKRYYWHGSGAIVSKNGKTCHTFTWKSYESSRPIAQIRNAVIDMKTHDVSRGEKSRAHQCFVANTRKAVLKVLAGGGSIGSNEAIFISRDNSWYRA